MQATLDSTSLKHITRALACLSKFGDDLTILATGDGVTLSSNNSTGSAYGRFRIHKTFFSRYRFTLAPDATSGAMPNIAGQLVTKSLLSILKHKTVEKSVERCEFVITDGPSADGTVEVEEEDTLESRLTVRLHCKHGVVKTHRLTLLALGKFLNPQELDQSQIVNKLVVGSKPLKDMVERFTFGVGQTKKSDPQLLWYFYEDVVKLKTLDTSLDAKGKSHLATELMISAEEFEQYDVLGGPIVLSWHLKEFNATIAFAEASASTLNIEFTDGGQPIYIKLDAELVDTYFVIAPAHVPGHLASSQTRAPAGNANPRSNIIANGDARGTKRARDGGVVSRPRKPMQVVKETDREEAMAHERQRQQQDADLRAGTPQPSWAVLTPLPPPISLRPSNSGARPPHSASGSASGSYGFPSQTAQPAEQSLSYASFVDDDEPAVKPELVDFDSEIGRARGHERRERTPLFLPSTQMSQMQMSLGGLSQAAEAAIRESGLGIENMTAEEFEMMMDGDAEEVDFSQPHGGGSGFGFVSRGFGQQEEAFALSEDEMLAPTQDSGSGGKPFRPLFED